MNDTWTSEPRLQGDRYVTGAIRYLDDGPVSGQLHLAFVRSPHAHAAIRGIDKSGALACAGVYAVLDGYDVAPLLANLVCRVPAALTRTAAPIEVPCIPTDFVRYWGEPVALVVAETESLARRAAALVAVDYNVLEPLLGIAAATASDARPQHPQLAGNVLMESVVSEGDADSAIGGAARVLEGRISIARSSAIPLEPRGCVASWDPDTGRLLIRAAVQQPHAFRAAVARQLGLPESDVQVVTPPLGGAFGFKFIGLPEEPLTCLAAHVLKRSVRWVENRAEGLLIGAREYELSFKVGFDDSGRVQGLSVGLDANIGALSATPGPLMPIVAASTFPGPYDVKHLSVKWRAIMTNKGPWNGARGFGKEATCLVLETAMDDIARELGMSPVAVRRRNLLRSDQMPHRTSTMTIDSGDYAAALSITLGLLGHADLPPPGKTGREGTRTRVGLGLAIELTPEGSDVGGSQSRGFETATVRVDTSGYATVLTGVTSPGTGSETAIAQLAAERLGIPTANVRVIQGDTDTTPYGAGSFSSRAVMAGGTAAWLAAGDLRSKLITTASVLLKCSPEQVEVAEGTYRVLGEPTRGMSVGALALALRTMGSALPGLGDPQLEATRTYGPQNLQSLRDESGRLQLYPTYSYSVHLAEVEVDLETGFSKLLNLSAVHDCGTVINKALVDAQFHGAIAMGVGMALSEEERYDDAGRPMSVSFKTYLLPRVKDVPSFRIGHLESPSPFTALGTKGAGESGVGGSAAAIVSAIRDAIRVPQGTAVELPMTPARVLALIERQAPELG